MLLSGDLVEIEVHVHLERLSHLWEIERCFKIKYLWPGNLLNSFDKDSLMKMMPTRAAKASSVNLTQKKSCLIYFWWVIIIPPCEISDNSRTVHSNNDHTEERRPKPNPESHREIIDTCSRGWNYICVLPTYHSCDRIQQGSSQRWVPAKTFK